MSKRLVEQETNYGSTYDLKKYNYPKACILVSADGTLTCKQCYNQTLIGSLRSLKELRYCFVKQMTIQYFMTRIHIKCFYMPRYFIKITDFVV